jgi:hypothetical protein
VTPRREVQKAQHLRLRAGVHRWGSSFVNVEAPIAGAGERLLEASARRT